MMETLELRIRRYMIAKFRRRAIFDLYDKASVAGLLESRFLGDDDAGGAVWSVPHTARQFFVGDLNRDREIVRRMIGSGARYQIDDGRRTSAGRNKQVGRGGVFDWSVPQPDKSRNAKKRLHDDNGRGEGPGCDNRYVFELLREHLPAPKPMHVAVALLVARAVGSSLSKQSRLTDALQGPTPFVLIKAPVPRFEVGLGMMLEDGLLLPFRVTLEDVMREGPLSGRFPSARTSDPRRRLKTLAGSAVAKSDEGTVRRRLRRAMTDEAAPIVLADEMSAALTPVVTETADLVLECTGFDRTMIADLLHICVGVRPEDSLGMMAESHFDPEGMSLDDLVLAVRPGRSAKEILAVLTMLIDRFAPGQTDHKHARQNDGKRGTGGSGSSLKHTDRKAKAQDVGIEVIEPAPVVACDANDPSAHARSVHSRLGTTSIEDLSGYGAARDWAIDLKTDLALWREGGLSWDEMSTKLLLSGPPGTGKTTYARALCNTLRIPLLATSVAHWLEPGYLGDVLKRMSAAFELATARAPAILFIDEIDGIGSRQSSGGRSYDDYWVSVINRLLELLDGASKTEGIVIVAATNLPEKIDPALLRSGRLETHVRVPLPDIDTLIEILAHHLGTDLPEVMSSASSMHALPRLKSRKARDHVSQQLRRNSEKRKSDLETGAKP